MGEPIRHEVHMDSEVAIYWYSKFSEFRASDEKYENLTYANYLGDYVLGAMKEMIEVTGAALGDPS